MTCSIHPSTFLRSLDTQAVNHLTEVVPNEESEGLLVLREGDRLTEAIPTSSMRFVESEEQLNYVETGSITNSQHMVCAGRCQGHVRHKALRINFKTKEATPNCVG